MSSVAPGRPVRIGFGAAVAPPQGGPNVDGPVKVGLSIPSSGLSGSKAACVTVSNTVANAIKANLGNFYVNVHNSQYPNGAIRGQLFQATATQDK